MCQNIFFALFFHNIDLVERINVKRTAAVVLTHTKTSEASKLSSKLKNWS